MHSIHSGYWVHVPSCLVPLLSHGIVLHLVLVFSAGQESQSQSSPFHPYFWNLDPSLQICFHLCEGKLGFMWLAAVNLKEGEKGKGWEDWGGDKQCPPYFNPSGFLWGRCGLTGQPGLELLLALDHFGQTDLLIARRRASCTSSAKTIITKLHYLGNLHKESPVLIYLQKLESPLRYSGCDCLWGITSFLQRLLPQLCPHVALFPFLCVPKPPLLH